MAKITKKQIEQLRDLSETFDYYQVAQICKGIQEGVDVSIYADQKYNDRQMYEICEGLISGVDVSVYANEQNNSDDMCRARVLMEQKLKVKPDLDLDVKLEQFMATMLRRRLE